MEKIKLQSDKSLRSIELIPVFYIIPGTWSKAIHINVAVKFKDGDIHCFDGDFKLDGKPSLDIMKAKCHQLVSNMFGDEYLPYCSIKGLDEDE